MRVLIFGLLSLGVSVAIPAAGSDEDYLAACSVQVAQRHGERQEIKLVSMRRSARGMRVKVALALGPGGTTRESVEFMTCLVSEEDLASVVAPTQPLSGPSQGAR